MKVSFTNSEVFVSESSVSVSIDLTAMGFTDGDAYTVIVSVIGGTAEGKLFEHFRLKLNY